MCETKAVVVSISLILIVAATFCIDQAHTEIKVGHHSKIKSHGPCENEYRKSCLNGRNCYYLVDDDIVVCNCTWMYGESDVKSTYGGTRLDFKIEKDGKFLF